MPIIAEFDSTGKKIGTSETAKVVKTEAEWRAQLDPQAFEVARNEGTEPAYTGKYAREKGDGVYRCACCGTALFDSRAKFDSGTGWPSYFEPIAPENVTEIADRSHGMVRTAVECTLCDAHLGHVFPDGPRPTGMRYCMNSAALTFVPRARE